MAVTLAATTTTATEAGSTPVGLVSRSTTPSDTATASDPPSVSDDGRYVTFTSLATNLVTGQVNAGRTQGVYLLDRVLGTLTLVSRTAASPVTNGNENSHGAVISGDGGFVAFLSRATDLVAGLVVPVGRDNVFVHDRVTGVTTLVSRTAGSSLTTGNGNSSAPAISADGQFVAFQSQATDLVAGLVDGNGSNPDVYVHDRGLGTTKLVSRTAGSPTTTGNDRSQDPVISADGAFVAFVSQATDLVAGLADGNGPSGSDVYLFARQSGTVKLVSRTVGSATTSGDGQSTNPAISADGHFVAFESRATDLVAGLTNANGSGADVFRHDHLTPATVLVSRSSVSATTTGDSRSQAPRISADGSLVAFESFATDLVAGQVGGGTTSNVFVRDLAAGTTVLVSRVPGSATTAGDRSSFNPLLSADGSTVAFESLATNLVPGQAGNVESFDSHLFLHRLSGTTTLVSRQAGSTATVANSFSESAGLSGDGRVVAFLSLATDLVAGIADHDSESDLFVFDADADLVDLVSQRDPDRPSQTTGDSEVGLHSVSGDGRFIVFTSLATNLVDGQVDANLADDVFLHDRESGTTALVSRAAGSEATASNLQAREPVISADGRFVAFTSSSTDLVPGQVPFEGTNVFVHDRVGGTTSLVSRTPDSAVTAGDDRSESPAISGDGSFIAFVSRASNLVPFQVDLAGETDVFVHDRANGTTVLASRAAASELTAGNDASEEPVISADGRFLAFVSRATDLVELQQDTNDNLDVFLYDGVSRTVRLVSRTAASDVSTGNGTSQSPVISADGRFVAFRSSATDLVNGQSDTNLALDVFLFDRTSGQVSLVSHRAGASAEAADGLSLDPTISADGRFVAFASQATDLVTGLVKGNTDSDVFLHDRVAGTTILVSRTAGSTLVSGNSSSGSPVLSADGRFVVFESAATDLVPVQVDGGATRNVFRHDRLAGTTTLVSEGRRRLAGRSGPVGPVRGNDLSRRGAVSDDGAVIVFESAASNLTLDQDRNGRDDVFVWVSPCADARPCPGTAARSPR